MTARRVRTLAGCVATVLCVFTAAAQAVVLPHDVAQRLDKRIDAFIEAPGHERFAVETMQGAELDPLARGILLFDAAEGSLESARYRITRHQRSLGGDWSDIRHSYIEITRYNLAPGLHRDNVATHGEHAAAAGPAVQLPHVTWRLVTTGLMGRRAHVVAASRRVVGPFEASRAICLDRLPCLALGGFDVDQDAGFETMLAPEHSAGPQATSLASPSRIAADMFRVAAGEYDELHEAATLEHPELELVIAVGSGGQERNTRALMHLTALMDDATAERWIRRLEVPGAVEWQHLDVAY